VRERPSIEPKFFETYHYADVITAVVEERFDHLRLWDEFLCDGAVAALVAPYVPESAFHAFIAFVIDRLLYDYTVDFDLDQKQALARSFERIPVALADLDPFTLPVERAMKTRRFDFESFVEWLKSHGKEFAAAEPDDINEYFQDLRLCGPYEELVARSAREVFFTLFTNRTLLLQFNAILAEHVADLAAQDDDEELVQAVAHYFERPGVLRRAHMPEWVRRAVFFRDRGRCVGCHTDLSGVVSLWSAENFDHMVPLASGGLNDVTNIQLLCAACNKQKADGAAFTSGMYEDWYPMTETRSPSLADAIEERVAPSASAAVGRRARKKPG
jgi:hypothetical protein